MTEAQLTQRQRENRIMARVLIAIALTLGPALLYGLIVTGMDIAERYDLVCGACG